MTDDTGGESASERKQQTGRICFWGFLRFRFHISLHFACTINKEILLSNRRTDERTMSKKCITESCRWHCLQWAKEKKYENCVERAMCIESSAQSVQAQKLEWNNGKCKEIAHFNKTFLPFMWIAENQQVPVTEILHNKFAMVVFLWLEQWALYSKLFWGNMCTGAKSSQRSYCELHSRRQKKQIYVSNTCQKSSKYYIFVWNWFSRNDKVKFYQKRHWISLGCSDEVRRRHAERKAGW